jgi:hypothetical protein
MHGHLHPKGHHHECWVTESPNLFQDCLSVLTACPTPCHPHPWWGRDFVALDENMFSEKGAGFGPG